MNNDHSDAVQKRAAEKEKESIENGKEAALKLLQKNCWAPLKVTPFDHFDLEDKTPTPVIPSYLKPDVW